MEVQSGGSRSNIPTTTSVTDEPDAANSPPVLRLRLTKPKSDRKVAFEEGVVDNEHMGKKKSKCCCIYKKPLAFGESSSESDEECEHCFGHPEKRRKNQPDKGNQAQSNHQHGSDVPDGIGCGLATKPTSSAVVTTDEKETTPQSSNSNPFVENPELLKEISAP